LNEKVDTLKEGWFRSACITLSDLLTRLQRQLTRVETVDTLRLPHSINRMVLNYFDRESQQVYIKYALEDALRIYKNRLIVILDEAYKFIPQRYGSACKQAIQDVITQGAATNLYIWVTTQFLAPTDKDPLKACAVRLLGTQDHITEATHTLDLIPQARQRGFDKDTIMTLPLGHFVVVTKREARLVYAVPDGVPLEVAGRVAMGELSPEYVRDNFLRRGAVSGEEEGLEEIGRLKREIEGLRVEVEEVRKLVFEKLGQLAGRLEELEALRGDSVEVRRGLERLLREFELLKQRFAGVGEASQLPASVGVGEPPSADFLGEVLDRVLPQLMVRVDRRFSQLVDTLDRVRVVKVDVSERILEQLKERIVSDLLSRIQRLSEELEGKPAVAAQIVFHRQRVRVSELNQALYRTKKPGGDFYKNIVAPLMEALLIERGPKRSGLLMWRFRENLKRELEGLVSEEELDRIHDYLLSFLILP
jgi:hypothetical protein